MDQGQGVSRLPGQGITPESECRSCAIAQGVPDQGTRSAATYVVEDVDEDAVVISGPELHGLVVVPRQHIGGLEELPVLRRANVLAALRRAARSVLERNPGSADQGRRDDRSSGIRRPHVLSRDAQRLGGSGALHFETRLSAVRPGPARPSPGSTRLRT